MMLRDTFGHPTKQSLPQPEEFHLLVTGILQLVPSEFNILWDKRQ
jgi:hypothetical protein